MAAVQVDIGAAVAATLAQANADGYFTPLVVTPERSYADWNDALEDLDILHVDVVPQTLGATLADRGRLQYDAQISVLVRKRFGPTARDASGRLLNAPIDELVLLLQRCYEYFVPGRALVGQPEIKWKPPRTIKGTEGSGSQFKAVYSRTMLRQNSQFSGWVVLGFVAVKEAE
jgi:hypothetical protein